MREAGVTVGDLLFFGALSLLAWWLIARRSDPAKKRLIGVVVAVAYLLLFVLPYVLPAGVAVVVRFLGTLALVVTIYIALCEMVAKAAERKGRSATAWFFIAFFFAIVIPAIIVAIMGPLNPATAQTEIDVDEWTKCPFCAEDIRVEAIKCKHCGSMVEPAS